MVARRKRQTITGSVSGVIEENGGLRVKLVTATGKAYSFVHRTYQYRRGQYVTVTGVVLGAQLLEVRQRILHPVTVSPAAEAALRMEVLVKYLTRFRDNCTSLGRSGVLLVDAYKVTVNRRGRIRVQLGEDGPDTGYRMWVKPVAMAIVEAQNKRS